MSLINKIKESDDPIWDVVFPISETICIAFGVIYGFTKAGIGGAIIGAIVGAIAGFLAIPIGGMLLVLGQVALVGAIYIAVIGGVIWLISVLWGVGKPG